MPQTGIYELKIKATTQKRMTMALNFFRHMSGFDLVVGINFNWLGN
jgi:hypothetical protein